MGIICFVAVMLLVSVVLALYVSYFSVEAPDWVEEDEYYRARWYK